MNTIDVDVFINKFIEELDNCQQMSFDASVGAVTMTPSQIIKVVADCAAFARSKASEGDSHDKNK